MRNSDSDVAVACYALGIGPNTPQPVLIDPTTTPEAIAADQRAVIQEFLSSGVDYTVTTLSDAICLPESVIRRRLKELHRRIPGWKKPPSKPKPKVPGKLICRGAQSVIAAARSGAVSTTS